MSDLFAENINGIKICYEIKGEGEPVLLVHGFSDRKEHWRAQFGDLSGHFKVIRFDNRGAGKSERPNGVYTMELDCVSIFLGEDQLTDFMSSI